MVKAYKLNVEGDFYVEDGECITCMISVEEAPDLMGFDEKEGHCYFKKQPATEKEIENAIEEIDVSCCSALRYCGTDPKIIKKLTARMLSDQIYEKY